MVYFLEIYDIIAIFFLIDIYNMMWHLKPFMSQGANLGVFITFSDSSSLYWQQVFSEFIIIHLILFNFLALLAKGQMSLCDGLSSVVCLLAIYKNNFF